MTTGNNLHLHVHLPEEIIVHILCWLPVESLNRVRCVSKRWRSIISDPQFAKSHFKLASEQKTLIRRHLVSLDCEFQSLDFEARSFGYESSVRKLTLPTLSKQPVRIYLLGSCNGFVYVADENLDLYLWNPSTRLVRKIPELDFWFSHHGLGYVSATDDYKLFDGSSFERYAQIFSLRANTWKRIKFPDQIKFVKHGLGALTNEALHWTCCKQGEKKPAVIAFDLAIEEFRLLPLPFLWEGDNMNNVNADGVVDIAKLDVQVLSEGCLCVSYYWRRSVEFWVMREYEVCESWTMLFKFNIDDLPVRIHRKLRGEKSFFVTESGTVVLKFYEDKELIRIKCHKEEKLVCTGLYSLNDVPACVFHMIQYYETLLSLPE